ncbi:LuxR family transcriptional regulator [Bosea sp. 124]|uniref:helix-turn-helix transcriptional regulator n=1 Tax=Bosea sp. 124 TaxID=2135642 RepID=UPI000D343C04|nr:LuxR family transcriptional regulator [Bosea sp. 124]
MSTVDSLLAGAFDAEQMPSAVEQLRQLFNGSKACLARVGPGMSAADAVSTNSDEAMQRRCYEDLAEDFIRLGETLRSVPVGAVYRDSELFGEEVLRSSRAWREWMAPQDMYGGIACRLAETSASYWFFDVQRGQRQEPFGADDTALLARFSPLLRKVAELSRQVGHLKLQRDEARGALDALAMAIVIVDRDLQVSYANEGADEILSDPDSAVGLRQGRLFARQPADQRQLKRLVEAALRSVVDPLEEHRSSMIIQGAGDDAPALSACVLPAAAAQAGTPPSAKAMIALRPLGMATDLVASSRQLFNLTESEARFASALASGLSLTQAAEAQGVRISTARTHLARIFQKTQTRQQSQLVSLLRGAVLPLRPRV